MKTLLLMLASAFCGILLFVAAVAGYFYWHYSSGGPVSFPPRSEKEMAVAPPIVEVERFYGTHAVTNAEFSRSGRQTVLAAGPGKIVGGVTSGGKPLKGLRLRLALNGAVMSQWGMTGVDGRYEVAVPYGKYRIDGYELDTKTANAVLAGKTDGPRRGFHHLDAVLVEEGRPGQGIDFGFVDPVRKLGPKGEVKAAEPVIVTWESYPGAAGYRLQLLEQKSPGDYEDHRYVFEWRERPIIRGTSAKLAEHKIALKKGHYYTIEIEAEDERKRTLSQSVRGFGSADFRVVE